MKGLLTLIKLSKRTLDELRRSMGALENQKEQLQLSLRHLARELEEEIRIAEKQPGLSGFFGDYSRRIKRRQEDIGNEITKLDAQIAKLNEQIIEAFAEMKRYEIARDNALARQKEQRERRETEMLDEIAGQAFTRKTPEE